MRDVKLNIEKIVEDVLHKIAETAVQNVIARHAGYGIDSEIKQAIRERAQQICSTDEVQALIKNQIVYWIRHN